MVIICKFYKVLFIIGIFKQKLSLQKIRIDKDVREGKGCVLVIFGVGIEDLIICV